MANDCLLKINLLAFTVSEDRQTVRIGWWSWSGM